MVAYNPVIAEVLAEKLGRGVEVAPQPQFTAALGAALAAALPQLVHTKGR